MSTYPASNEGYPKVCEDLTITERALSWALLYDRCEISIYPLILLWSCEAGGDTENICHYLSLPGRSSDYLQVASPEIAERRCFVTEPSVNILSPAPHSQSRQTATLHGVTQCYMLHVTCSYSPEYKAAHVCRVWVYLFIQPVIQHGPRLGQGVLCDCVAAHFTRHQTGVSQFRTWHWQAGLWLYWCTWITDCPVKQISPHCTQLGRCCRAAGVGRDTSQGPGWSSPLTLPRVQWSHVPWCLASNM